MKILIVSDTHRADTNLEKVIAKEKPFDMLIHLGDVEGSELKISHWLDVTCAFHIVLGNNDFFSRLDKEKEISLGNYRAFITHGHQYGVSMGPEILVDEAKSRHCDMVMFGHTHKPFYEIIDGVHVINPGSISYPRQEGRKPSYMRMDIDENGRIDAKHIFLELENRD